MELAIIIALLVTWSLASGVFPRQHTVEELSESCSDENTIDANADATAALAKMSQNGNSRLIVVKDGKLRGIIGLKDLMKFISLKVELEDV